jgi:hypothetical protein
MTRAATFLLSLLVCLAAAACAGDKPDSGETGDPLCTLECNLPDCLSGDCAADAIVYDCTDMNNPVKVADDCATLLTDAGVGGDDADVPDVVDAAPIDASL